MASGHLVGQSNEQLSREHGVGTDECLYRVQAAETLEWGTAFCREIGQRVEQAWGLAWVSGKEQCGYS